MNKCFFVWEKAKNKIFDVKSTPNGGNESIYVYLFPSLCSTRTPVVRCVIPSSGFVIVTGSSSIFFSRRKKKIVGRMGRTFTVLVALDSCYLLGRSRKTFLFTTCRVMTGRTVSCHSCVMHFLSFHSVIFLFIRETQANSSRCVCFVLSCCILFLF